jgi:hypothetical protein
MHHDLDLLVAQDSSDGRLVAEVHFVQRDVGRDGLAVAVDEIVDDDRPVPGGDELANTMTADVTGASNDENVHDEELDSEPRGIARERAPRNDK